MDLKKFLPGNPDADKKEYLWTLIIEPGWVQAGIWRIEGQKAQIVLYSPPFSWEVEEDLVTASDNALSASIQGFPEGLAEPQKAVFGVTPSWVTEGQIKAEYLAKIKVVCSELSIKPIGFVVLPEAIAHLIKADEGSPLNAAVLGVYKENLEITLFKLGSLLGTTEVSRSVSVVDDVAEGLARFGLKEPIPSRIVLYDGREGELEEVRQSLLKVNWEDDTRLKFLHTPKVELVASKDKVFAVSLAGASEMATVTSVESARPDEDEDKIVDRKDNLTKHEFHKTGLPPETAESQEAKINDPEAFADDQDNLNPEDLGFVLEKDITHLPTSADNQKTKSPAEMPETDEVHRNVTPVVQRSDNAQNLPKQGGFNKASFSPILANLKEKFRTLKLPKFRLPSGLRLGGNKLFYLGIGFFVILLIAGAVAWWVLPKAVVTVYVSPQRLEEEFTMTVDTAKDSPDYSNKVLAGSVFISQVDGDKTKDATGSKTVGDKAKGEVTLYRVGTEITIPTGTVLHGPETLNFTLDGEVTVASGSAGSAGTTKAPVVAEDIGAEYNLASGTTFRVGNFTSTDLEAKNENSFSGGSSREITAVSADDMKTLEEDLTDELINNAKTDLLEKVTAEDILIEESVAATTSSKTFSNKEGDEAETLRLSLEVEANAVAVPKQDMVELASQVLKDRVPEGFVLRGDQIDFELTAGDTDESVYEFEVRVSANLLPEVKTDDIVTRIRGRNPTVTEEYLNREVPGFVRAEIKITPQLPAKIRTLPHLAKNIEVEVAAER